MNATTAPARTDVRDHTPVLDRLGRLHRLLPMWIGAAMLLGLALGRVFPA